MKHPRLLVALVAALGLALVLGVVLGFLLWGGSGSGGVETGPATTIGGKSQVRVYWLRDGKVWPVQREVDTTGGVVNGTVAQLLLGPTKKEQNELAARTAIPGDVTRAEISIAGGVARVQLSGSVPRPALAQLAYTLTQFPTVDSVELSGKSYTSTSFEDVTPAILVESPLAYEEVASPLRARGTANTFEATFDYELTDTAGKVLAKHFVTATSGNGMRGTFQFEAPFTVAGSRPGTLTVFEISAANGKRIHSVAIPLQLRAR
jgi:immunoglobulin-like protein involved in spore germination/sporulation and spore germination protein